MQSIEFAPNLVFYQWRIQDFPDVGANLRAGAQPIIWQNICRELHGIERIWNWLGVASLGPATV